jgi:hypothetical protein
LIFPNNIIQVIGNGWVKIYNLKNTSIINGIGNNIGGHNIILHILQDNEKFDLNSGLII